MRPEQKGVLERIERAPLVSEEGDVLFTKKLAHQNGWSLEKAVRAIKEYKRFLCLALEAGHGVSPSDAVDQVWHLHLMYTNEYWNVFCPKVLKKALHHHPSSGGKSERDRLNGWYEATLESYRKFFDEDAPEEWWPAPAKKVAIDRSVHQRVDLAECWVIPKPKCAREGLLKPVLVLVFGVLLLVFATGCAQIGNNPPWNFNGPEFLEFFVGLLIGCWAVAYRVRRSRRVPAPHGINEIPELSVYEMAYLGGGEERVFQAALGKLATDGLIDIDAKTKGVIRSSAMADPGEIESMILDRVRGQKVHELQKEMEPALGRFHKGLENSGLLVPSEAQKGLILMPFLIAALPVLIGGLKVYVGVMRGRPIGFLIFLVAVATFVAMLFFRKGFRSRKGDAVLDTLQREHETIKAELSMGPNLKQAALVALAVGLFGASALANTSYAFLEERLGPDKNSGGCGGGGGEGGCGGGGCGGCG